MKTTAAKPATKKEAAKRDQMGRQPTGTITLKASIADPLIDGVLSRYGLTVDSDAPRHIYFFDTPDLALHKLPIDRRIAGNNLTGQVKVVPEQRVQRLVQRHIDLLPHVDQCLFQCVTFLFK